MLLGAYQKERGMINWRREERDIRRERERRRGAHQGEKWKQVEVIDTACACEYVHNIQQVPSAWGEVGPL